MLDARRCRLDMGLNTDNWARSTTRTFQRRSCLTFMREYKESPTTRMSCIVRGSTCTFDVHGMHAVAGLGKSRIRSHETTAKSIEKKFEFVDSVL